MISRYFFYTLLACIFCLISSQSLKAQLNGSYTVDKSKPAGKTNYKDLASCLNDLSMGTRSDGGIANGKGVSGPVVIKIADDRYQGQFSLSSIKGTSSVNTLTFTSISGDSSKVQIGDTVNIFGSSACFFIGKISFVNFSNIGFVSLGTVICMGDSLHDINLSHCYLKSQDVSPDYNVINANGFNMMRNVSINNNLIRHGSYGLFFIANGGYFGKNNTFSNNIIDGGYTGGMYLQGFDSMTVSGNHITNFMHSGANGMMCGTIKNSTIEKNYISGSSVNYGINLTACSNILLRNNMISLYKASGFGIWPNGAYIDVLYNTINMYGGSINSGCVNVYCDSAYKSNIRDNVFVNTDGGYIYNISRIGLLGTADYNDIRSTGSNLMVYRPTRYGTQSYAYNMSAWIAATGLDSHSVTVSPIFKSNTDLHAANQKLQIGEKLSSVTDDYDRDKRKFPACIGADEFPLFHTDASIIADSVYATACPNTNTRFVLKLWNAGLDTLKSAKIRWLVNDTLEADHNWSGKLARLDTAVVYMGSHMQNSGITSFKAWVYSPNGSADSSALNDTIAVRRSSFMKGQYTIGGKSPDYNTFTDAVNDLVKRGVCGNVVFNVRDGVYSEQLTIPHIKGTWLGSSVTFQSESGDSSKVILTSKVTYKNLHVITLYRSRYVNFNYITITRSGILQDAMVYVYDTAIGIGFSHDAFVGDKYVPNLYTPYNNDYLIKIQGNCNINLQHNLFQYGLAGVYAYCTSGNYFVRSSIKLVDNIFDHNYTTGPAYLQYFDTAIVSRNKVYSTAQGSYGIYLAYTGYTIVERNDLQMTDAFSALYTMGAGYIIRNNSISIQLTKEPSVSAYAIYDQASGSSKEVDILDNSINIYGTGSKNLAIKAYRGTGNPYYIEGNNIVNTTAGAIYNLSGGFSPLIDYDNYSVPNGSFGYWNGTSANNFTNWKKTSKTDVHSLNADPWYLSRTDLTPVNPLLDASGINLTNAQDDFYGKLRGSSPDIGAISFDVPYNNAGLARSGSMSQYQCPASNKLSIVVRNEGVNYLSSLKIRWPVATGIKTLTWTGYLAPGDSDIISDTLYAAGMHYRVKIWADSPNASASINKLTDTIDFIFSYGLNGTYTVGGNGADFATPAAALASLNQNGRCGPVTFKIRNGVYDGRLELDSALDGSDSNIVTLMAEEGDSGNVVFTDTYSKYSTDTNYILVLNSAHNCIFKNIHFVRSNADLNSRLVDIRYRSCNFTFQKCSFIGKKLGADSMAEPLFYYKYDNYALVKVGNASTLKLDQINNIFQDNTFKYGAYGLYYTGNINIGSNHRYLLLDHNTFDSCQMGAYIQTYDSTTISTNTFRNTLVHALRVESLEYFGSPSKILNNHIYMPDSRGYGVAVTGDVINNKILVHGYAGLVILEDPVGAHQINNVEFNNIAVLSYGHNCYQQPYGAPERQNSAALIAFGNMNAENNNLYTETSVMCIINDPSQVMWWDHNNYYFPTDRNSFSEPEILIHKSIWNIYSGFSSGGYDVGGTHVNVDKNSINVDPFYDNWMDMTVQNPLLKSAGTGREKILYDIKGIARDSLKPSVGADELHPPLYDAMPLGVADTMWNICADSTIKLKLSIANLGTDTIRSLPVTVTLKSGAITKTVSEVTKASISPGEKGTVTLIAKVFLNKFTNPRIFIHTGLKNDSIFSNDTISENIEYVSVNPVLVRDLHYCSSGKLKMTVKKNGADKIYWYRNSSDSIPYYIGDTLTTKYTYNKDSFYVANASIGTAHSGFKYATNAFSDTLSKQMSVYSNNARPDPFTFDSATVYPAKSGSFRITIKDKYNNTVAGKIVNVSANASFAPVRVGLGLIVPNNAANSYSIIIDSITTGGLYTQKMLDIYHHWFNKSTFWDTRPMNFIGECTNYYYYPYLYDLTTTYGSCDNARQKIYAIAGTSPSLALDQDAAFNGVYADGTLSRPDSICSGNSAVYDIFTTFDNRKYGTDWKIKSVSISTPHGVAYKDTSMQLPGNSGQGVLKINSTNTYGDSTIVIKIQIGSLSGGCDSSVTRYLYISPSPIPNFRATNLCFGDTGKFFDSTTNAGTAPHYAWDFGDGSPLVFSKDAVHQFKKQGTYVVTHTVSNSDLCSYSSQKIVAFHLDANISGLVAACAGSEQAYIAAHHLGSFYHWYIKGGTILSGAASDTVLVKWDSAGTGTIAMAEINASHCKDSVAKNVTVYPLPKAKFAIDGFCFHSATIFTDLSTNAVERHWDFGDSTFSEALNPKHIFPHPGTYHVRLYVTSRLGCSDTSVQTINIDSLPVPDFTLSSYCVGRTIKFTNKSTNSAGWQWDFGDGSSSIAENPSHKYFTAGKYDIKLKAIAVTACMDSIVKTITIGNAPVAGFSVAPSCPGEVPAVKNNSMYADHYKWYFGDSATSTDSLPLHRYTKGGLYTISLVAYSTYGCSDSVSAKELIYTPPTTDFTYSTLCTTPSVAFKDNSSIGSDTIQSYYWDFGDSNTTTVRNPIHRYAHRGVYNVTYVLTTHCNDTIHKQIIIPRLKAAFGYVNACLNDSIIFQDSSLTDGIKISSYSWNFGDSTASSLANPKHKYKKTGTYKVSLRIQSALGCIDTVSRTVIVHPAPKAYFKTTDVCLGDDMVFTDSSAVPSGGNTVYYWSFGDGKTSTQQNPTHQYNNAGVYKVVEMVISGFCRDSFSRTVTVWPAANAVFSYSVTGQHVQFIPDDTLMKTYAWDFGDTTSSTLIHPEHRYQHTGTYTVTLKTSSSGICQDSMSENVTIISAGLTETAVKGFSVNVYPNPFSDNANIDYSIAERSMVQINIFDELGRKIELQRADLMPAGQYHLQLKASNLDLAPGLYHVQFIVNSGSIVKPLIMVR